VKFNLGLNTKVVSYSVYMLGEYLFLIITVTVLRIQKTQRVLLLFYWGEAGCFCRLFVNEAETKK
jgi:hypothetical protein